MRTLLLAVLAVLAAGVLGVLGDPLPAAADVPPPANAHTAHAHWAAGNQIPAAPHEDVVKRAWAKGCAHRYTMTCLKLDVVSFVDRISDTEELQVLPGVTVVRENASAGGAAAEARGRAHAALLAALAKDYPRDADARVDAYLARRVGLFLDTHALNVRLLDAASAAAAAARSFGDDWDLAASAAAGAAATDSQGTGRGKDKKGGYGQLLAMGMMMKGMMGAMAMAGVAAIAGKALIVGLMALTLAAIAGLKSLAGGGGGKAVTYEIVSKPVYSHEHSHSHEVQHGHGGGGGGYGHSSYGRSFDETAATAAAAGGDPSALEGGRSARAMGDAHDLAYSAYLQAPQRPTAHPAP